jgi:hypothetical protein
LAKIEGREGWGESREEGDTFGVERHWWPDALSPVSFLLTPYFFDRANGLDFGLLLNCSPAPLPIFGGSLDPND